MNNVFDQRFTVAVCDSQPLIVAGLRVLLANSPHYHLTEPSGSLEALNRIIATAAPRIVILDKAAGGPDLMQWLGSVRDRSDIAVIVWASSISDAEGIRLLQAGAKGVLRKTAQPENLLACLDSVAAGVTWMDDNLFRNSVAVDVSFRPDLTRREQQVLHLVEQGLRNKEIASELGIRPGTVKIHLKHIFEKSGVRGRYGLVLSGLRERSSFTALPA